MIDVRPELPKKRTRAFRHSRSRYQGLKNPAISLSAASIRAFSHRRQSSTYPLRSLSKQLLSASKSLPQRSHSDAAIHWQSAGA